MTLLTERSSRRTLCAGLRKLEIVAKKDIGGKAMRTIFVLIAVTFLAASASAAPLLNQQNHIAAPSLVENVRIVCEPNGYCYRQGRPAVARWVYGDGAFYGPYTGPGNYGKPGWHSGWLWWGLW
jgi:hypothetical protein